MIKTAALIAVAGMAFAPAAADNRGGERARIEQVQALAHEMEDATARLRLDARRTRHHFSLREQRALRQLDSLAESARRFHREMERFPRRPGMAGDEFDSLTLAFRQARRTFPWLHPYRPLEIQFGRVERLMDRLGDRYLIVARGGRGYGRGEDDHRYGREHEGRR
ncbi:MAG TPA: hypothetical protein VJV23_09775 [Candidatus Polarisedimenticolia bacterium]|nr:hypothetical protein [Candidatus Polarisedimenticolia bacterium]